VTSDQIVQDAAGESGAPAPRRSVLANRDFAKLWAGESVSLIGTQVTQFALPLVAILSLNATVLEVGVLNALRFVPVILLSLFAGVWLDRRRRRPVLIACALGSSLLIGLVPLASVTGLLSIGLLYAVTALVGTLNMVFDVGALSYVPSLVPREQLAEGNSKIQVSTAVAGISGPGLAGLLVGLITAPVTLSVDAVSYLFSAGGLIAIRRPEPEPAAPAHASVARSIAEGWHAVYGSRLLRALLAQSTALNLFFGSFWTIFVVYAVRDLGLSPVKLGIVVAAASAGGLFGALLAARARTRLGFGRMMAVITVAMSAGPLLLLIPRGAGPLDLVVLMTAQAWYGFTVSMFNVNAITLRQVVTPRRLLARMNATYRMLLWGSAPVGATAGGLLGSAVGLHVALVVSLIAMTSPVLWLFTSPVFRLREMPGPSAEDAMADAPGPADLSRTDTTRNGHHS
jgi:MFS family permease